MTRNLSISIISFAILAGVTSCQGSLDYEKTAIALTIDNESLQTKAFSITEGTVPSDYTIYLSASLRDDKNPSNNGSYATMWPFTKKASKWSGDPALYWPVTGNLSFLALASDRSRLDLAARTVVDPVSNVSHMEIDVPDGSCLDSEILFGRKNGVSERRQDVSLPMKHTQAWIQFLLASEHGNMFMIDRIVLRKAYTGGNLIIDNGVFLDAKWDFARHRGYDITVPGSEGLILGPQTKELNILLPEQDACDFTMYYYVKGSPEESWDEALFLVYHHEAEATPYWYGVRKIYQMNVSQKEIYLRLGIKQWNRNDIVIDELPD